MTEAIRLLYAEDNAQDADLTRTYFEHESADFALEVVETGAQCLARLAAEHFDLLLLDKRLPDMDGLDLLARLRAGGQGLPVVMVTGIGDDETVARALRAGAADYVPKSADYLSTLPAILRGVVARERQRRPLDEKGGQRVQRILYVEPNPMDVELTRSHFAAQAPHLALHSVSDASEALALLEPGLGQAFDLVLTDLRLPGMNSLEFIHEAQQRGINLPFIVITGRGDEATAVALLRLGAYDYLLKRENYLTKLPFTIDNVLERFELDRTARRLHGKLESLNATLEQKVATRTAELQAEIQRRTALESQQRALHAQLRFVTDHAPVLLAHCDQQQRYRFVNQPYAEMFALPAADFVGKPLRDVLGEAAYAEAQPYLKAVLAGQAVEYDMALPSTKNGTRYVHAAYAPERDASGQVFGVVAAIVDITERQQAEQQIRAQLDELLHWQELMVGREQRMLELKAEVNELRKRLGEAARYAGEADA